MDASAGSTRSGTPTLTLLSRLSGLVESLILPQTEHVATGIASTEHVATGIASGVLSSAGRAWATVAVRVVDGAGGPLRQGEVGEVAVRAPQMMSGYWRNPELSRKAVRDGWLYTNDLGHLDDRDFLYLVGRKDEMIISGGFNIAPRDVEEVLYQHPAIREVAVVGQTDAQWGHAVVAYAALKADATSANILEFSRPLLGFKSKHLYIVNELPKSSNGKIERKMLTPELAQGRSAAIRPPHGAA